MNHLNFYPQYNPIIYTDVFGDFYQIINGIPTYSLPDGSLYYKDQYGVPYSYDQYGHIYYFDENWNAFYIDQYGKKFYYDEFGNVFYCHNEAFIEETEQEISSAIISSNKLDNVHKEITKALSKNELFSLFNIKNDHKNIRFPYLSDHSIVWYEVNQQEESDPLGIVSWNLLRKGHLIKFNQNLALKKKYNNPWNLSENETQYTHRFQIQNEKIIELIEKLENLSLIFLQEAYSFFEKKYITYSESFIEKLKLHNWDLIQSNDKKLDVIILFNKNRLEIFNKPKTTFKISLKCNTILQSYFIDKFANKIIFVGNVHFPPNYTLKKVDKYINDCKREFLKIDRNIMGIWGGDTNKRADLFIGDDFHFSSINRDKSKSRKDYLFFSIPEKCNLAVKEMPTCYFDLENSMSLSKQKQYILDINYVEKERKKRIESEIEKSNKINKDDFIKKISQKIDYLFQPYGKLFLSHNMELNLFEIRIYDNEKAEKFLKLMNVKKNNTKIINENNYVINLTLEEMFPIFQKYFRQEHYSLFYNSEDDFTTIPIRNDLFTPFVPLSQKEKKYKKQYLL